MSEPKKKKKNRFWILLNQLYDLFGFLVVCLLAWAIYIFLERRFVLHDSYVVDFKFLAEIAGYIILASIIPAIIFFAFREAIFVLLLGTGLYFFVIKDYKFKEECNKYYNQYISHISSFKVGDYNKIILFQYHLEKSSDIIYDIIEKYNHHSKVRNLSLKILQKKGLSRRARQTPSLYKDCFIIYNYVNKQWKYTKDPKDKEFFATPVETMKHFSGDCDDYTIFLTALLSSIGADVRLILTEGHIYPELCVGSPSQFFIEIKPQLIDMFYSPFYYQEDFFYHIDKEGKLWLNMDFGNSPGCKFLDERILKVIYI